MFMASRSWTSRDRPRVNPLTLGKGKPQVESEESQPKLFLEIKNWNRYQPSFRRMKYVRDWADREDDPDFCSLSAFERAILEGICRLRARTGKHAPHNAHYIGTALSLISTDRPHVGHALGTLISRGFLVPTNQQVNISNPVRIEENRLEENRKPPISPLPPKLETENPAEPEKPKPKPRQKQPRLTFDVPDWVPKQTWAQYVAMRQKIKKPLTEYAVDLAISKLLQLRNHGSDPQKVLEQSILNSWQGLFELHGGGNGNHNGNGGNGRAKTLREKLAEVQARRQRERVGFCDPDPLDS